jgi:hypothetical protein
MVTTGIPTNPVPEDEPELRPSNLEIFFKDLSKIYARSFFKIVIPVATVNLLMAYYVVSIKPITYSIFGTPHIHAGAFAGYIALTVVLTLIVFTMAIHVVASYHINRNHFMGQTFIITMRRFLSVVGVYGLYFVIVAVVSFVAGLFFIVPLFGLIILILLIPLVLYFAVKWAFALHAVIIEGANPIDAFSRSSELVSDNWWRAFGIMLLVGVIVAAIDVVFSLVFGFMKDYSSIIGSAVTAPLTYTGVTLLYYDLRARNEHCFLSKVSLELNPQQKSL